MDIRPATIRDIEAVCRLYAQLFDANCKFAPEYYRPAAQGEDYPLSAVNGEKADILVAVEDGAVVGFAHVIEQETPKVDCIIPLKYAFLAELAVDSGCRGRGVGGALLGAVKSWAKARGLSHVELNVLERNTAAQRVYEAAGFAPVTRNMRCPL